MLLSRLFHLARPSVNSLIRALSTSSHLRQTCPPGSNKTIANRYLNLDQRGMVQIMYVWIDGTGEGLRAKTRTVSKEPERVEDLSDWSYDGSSTYQAMTGNSDVKLKPVCLFADPFRGGKNKLVLCETFDFAGTPLATNHRRACAESMEKAARFEPEFGMEQEYTFFDEFGRPLGWPTRPDHSPEPQGPYYCSVGAGRVYGRDIVESHYRACLHAGIKLGGTNAEVMLAQWEYQVGVCSGIEMGDHLWMARFLMERIAEEFGVRVSLQPKPLPQWNGAGCHANLSTKAMRDRSTGLEWMEAAMPKLERAHSAHLAVYGAGNEARLTGHHETSAMDAFSWGVGDRSVSVRIPRPCHERRCGWIEDRRPAANCDPYLVTNSLVRTVCLDDE